MISSRVNLGAELIHQSRFYFDYILKLIFFELSDLLENSNLAAKWPLSNNAFTMQQFMLYNKVVQEEKARNRALPGKDSPSGFRHVLALDPFEANQKTTPTLAAQVWNTILSCCF